MATRHKLNNAASVFTKLRGLLAHLGKLRESLKVLSKVAESLKIVASMGAELADELESVWTEREPVRLDTIDRTE